MTAKILSGKEASARVLEGLRVKVRELKPKLVIIQVGENPASDVYIEQKLRACASIGMAADHKKLPEMTTIDELLRLIRECNADTTVTGFIVQMPLPSHLEKETARVQEAIDPNKDVDGFHPENLKKLEEGKSDGFVPATPAGVVLLLDDAGIEIKGRHAVVIGRSNTVGKPLAFLLKNRGARVDVIHRETTDPVELMRRADLLFAAAGSPKLVKWDMIKPGAVVVDIGITRIDGQLLGDVDFDMVKEVASAITPVPGGVGPMTVASLLKNTVMAAERSK